MAKEIGLSDMTLPQLMGNITERIMRAMLSDNSNVKATAINDCRRDMRIWYEAQSVEKRRELALSVRKAMETFKLIGEQFYMEAVTLTAQDM